MNHKLSIIGLLFISFLIYSCCKEKTYNASIASLNYFHQNDTNNFDNNTMSIRFKLGWDNQLISNVSLFNEATAHGLGSGAFKCDNNTYQPLYDQVAEIQFTCDKNLIGYNSGTDLKPISSLKIEYKDSIPMLDLISKINTLQYKYSTLSLDSYIPASKLEKSNFHTFTLKIKTVSGKEFVAVTKPIYWKK